MNTWLRAALSAPVVRCALSIALLVGPVLVLIIQGDHLVNGDRGSFSWTKAALTIVVPYLVSTGSSEMSLPGSNIG